MCRKFDYWYLLLVIPILRFCLPWLQYRVRVAVIVPFFFVWLIHMTFLPVRGPVPYWRQLRISFLFVIVFAVIYELLPLLYGRFGLSYSSRVVFNWGKFVSAVAACFYMSIIYLSFVHKRFKELAFLLMIILCAGILSGVQSFLHGDLVEGGAARFMVTAGSDLAKGKASAFNNAMDTVEYGLAGYGLTYFYAFGIPLLVYACLSIRKNWLMRFFYICASLGFGVAVAKGGLQTPIMVAGVGIGLVLLSLLMRLRKGIIVLGVGLMVALWTFSVAPKVFSFLESPLRAFAQFSEKPVYKERLTSLADAVRGDTNSYAYSRYQLQKRSWDIFCGNLPFGGGRNVQCGDHSEFFDMLGYFGFVGLTVWVLYLICLTRFFIFLGKAFCGQKYVNMLYLYISAYLFASVANPVPLVNSLVVIMISALGLYFPFAPLSVEMKTREQLTNRMRGSYA